MLLIYQLGLFQVVDEAVGKVRHDLGVVPRDVEEAVDELLPRRRVGRRQRRAPELGSDGFGNSVEPISLFSGQLPRDVTAAVVEGQDHAKNLQ